MWHPKITTEIHVASRTSITRALGALQEIEEPTLENRIQMLEFKQTLLELDAYEKRHKVPWGGGR